MLHVKRAGLVKLVAGLVLMVLTGGLFAGAPPKREMEKELYTTLRVVINQGAELFNTPRNDHAGCVRLFQGSLTTIRPLLSQYPELQKTIDGALTKAKGEQAIDAAFTLRKALDEVRATLKQASSTTTTVSGPDPKAKTLWGRLGGEETVGKVLDEFFATAGKDPKVNADRDGAFPHTPEVVQRLKKEFVAFLSDATGGPYKYDGKNMKAAHQGMKIKGSEFDAAGGHFKKALEKFKVASADVNAVMTILGSFKKDIVEPETAPTPVAKKLWERLGEKKGATKIADEYLANILTDPKVDFDRNGKYKVDKSAFVKDLSSVIGSVAGGPAEKLDEGKWGSIGLTGAQQDAAIATFKKTLEELKIAKADAGELSNKIDSTLRKFVDATAYRSEIPGEKKKEEKKTEKKKEDEKKTEKKKEDEKKKVEPKVEPKNVEPGRVSGRVMINGKAANIGYVVLVSAETGRSYGTYISSEGNYGFKLDLPAGKYTVAIQPANDPRTDKPLPGAVAIPPRYQQPATSELRVEVQPGNNSFNFDLKN